MLPAPATSNARGFRPLNYVRGRRGWVLAVWAAVMVFLLFSAVSTHDTFRQLRAMLYDPAAHPPDATNDTGLPADPQFPPAPQPAPPINDDGVPVPGASDPLAPWPPEDPRPTEGTTSLGLEADASYHLGFLSRPHYKASLSSFIRSSFPAALHPKLERYLDAFVPPQTQSGSIGLSADLPLTIPKLIWQTHKAARPEGESRSWREQNAEFGYEWEFLSDDGGAEWVKKNLGGSTIEKAYNALPHPILKADFLRYLLLLVEGGIYSDFDTTCLKPVPEWGSHPEFSRAELDSDKAKSVIIGIEADVGTRPDWHQWYPRPLQIVQWTLASAPGHPIFLDAVRRVVNNTLEWSEHNGPRPSVMDWTGPGVFTDTALRYLAVEGNVKWSDLRNRRIPLQVSNVVVLPVTGFSPGVGQFGAGGVGDSQAMVRHSFAGSWKGGIQRRSDWVL